jgi:hypothetical protein
LESKETKTYSPLPLANIVPLQLRSCKQCEKKHTCKAEMIDTERNVTPLPLVQRSLINTVSLDGNGDDCNNYQRIFPFPDLLKQLYNESSYGMCTVSITVESNKYHSDIKARGGSDVFEKKLNALLYQTGPNTGELRIELPPIDTLRDSNVGKYEGVISNQVSDEIGHSNSYSQESPDRFYLLGQNGSAQSLPDNSSESRSLNNGNLSNRSNTSSLSLSSRKPSIPERKGNFQVNGFNSGNRDFGSFKAGGLGIAYPQSSPVPSSSSSRSTPRGSTPRTGRSIVSDAYSSGGEHRNMYASGGTMVSSGGEHKNQRRHSYNDRDKQHQISNGINESQYHGSSGHSNGKYSKHQGRPLINSSSHLKSSGKKNYGDTGIASSHDRDRGSQRYIYIYTYIHIHTCVCMYIYVCVYICIYMYV